MDEAGAIQTPPLLREPPLVEGEEGGAFIEPLLTVEPFIEPPFIHPFMEAPSTVAPFMEAEQLDSSAREFPVELEPFGELEPLPDGPASVPEIPSSVSEGYEQGWGHVPPVHVPHGHAPPPVSSHGRSSPSSPPTLTTHSLAARDMLSPDVSMSPDASSGVLEGEEVTGGDVTGGAAAADDYSLTGGGGGY